MPDSGTSVAQVWPFWCPRFGQVWATTFGHFLCRFLVFLGGDFGDFFAITFGIFVCWFLAFSGGKFGRGKGGRPVHGRAIFL